MRLLVASVLLVALVAQADGPETQRAATLAGSDPLVVPAKTGHPNSTDAGTPEQVTFAQLGELATEYGCPDAGPPEVLDGGFRLEDPARAARVDCLLARSSAEVFSWRGMDAGTVSAPDNTTVHIITAIVGAASSIFTAYAASRSARHLQLWPP